MDEIDHFGFIPNGGRIYCAYSPRPLAAPALHPDVRAVRRRQQRHLDPQARVPLAECELTFWQTKSTMNVTSLFMNRMHAMAQYLITNTSPRPESYLQDLFNASAMAALYAELASDTETGWGYSVWWLVNVHVGNASQGLRALNVRGMVPVDSNTIPV
ncbi:hypothetical protein K438DRAFT_1991298 [Mycena galopus ATCC 62051]|nr:hypothetical protein K438DRAFT_1991298 [Mycena galopus ATCC 62051]